MAQGIWLDRNLRNAAQDLFYRKARAKGWKLTKRGWPCFFVQDQGGRVALIEVLNKSNAEVKPGQRMMLEYFASRGLSCYVWTPDGKLRKMRRDGVLTAVR